MNKHHLWWILPATFIFAFSLGFVFCSGYISFLAHNYQTIDCIIQMEDSMNVANNKLPFTRESQREAIEWRCATENINLESDYESLLVFKE